MHWWGLLVVVPRVLGIEPFTFPPLYRSSTLGRGFFNKGVELEIQKLVIHFVQNEDVFYDIGMNAGFFTLLPAALGASVISFDPQPDCLSPLRTSLEEGGVNANLSQRITLVNAGLADHSGILKVGRHQCDPGFSITPRVAEGLVNVPILPANVFQMMHQAIKMIKIDTEGAEIPILRSLSRNINFQYLVVELIPFAWEKFQIDRSTGLSVLTQLQQKAKKTYLLSDRRHFRIPATKETIDSTDIVALTNFDMQDLIADRLLGEISGCNLFFVMA
jgi:FkbM family methyltransferase